jgi:hypothetical protein
VHSDEGVLPYETKTDHDYRFFDDCSADFWPYPRELGGTEVLRKIAFEGLAIEKRDLECVVSLYDAGIAYTDDAIGRLLDELRRLGIYEDALVILTGDHGEGFMEHGRVLHSQPYRELTRVPLIMKFPGSKRHARIEEMIGLIDLMPMREAAGRSSRTSERDPKGGSATITSSCGTGTSPSIPGCSRNSSCTTGQWTLERRRTSQDVTRTWKNGSSRRPWTSTGSRNPSERN